MIAMATTNIRTAVTTHPLACADEANVTPVCPRRIAVSASSVPASRTPTAARPTPSDRRGAPDRLIAVRCSLSGGCERSPWLARVVHVIAEASEMASAGNDCSRIGSLATDPWTPRGKEAIVDIGVDGDHSVDTARSAHNLDSGFRGVGRQHGRHGRNRARRCSKQQQT
jgi:hypothetical protein